MVLNSFVHCKGLLTRVDICINLLGREGVVVKELKTMNYSTGLRPCSPIRTKSAFQSVLFPVEEAGEDEDHVFQIHPPFLSTTKLVLRIVMKYKTLHRSQNKHLPDLFTDKGLPQVLEAAVNRFWAILDLSLPIIVLCCFPTSGENPRVVRGNLMSCSLGASSAAEHLEELNLFCLPSKQRRRTTKPAAITRPFLWMTGSTFPSRCPLHKVFCCWLEKLEERHQEGNACMAFRWTDQTKPHKLISKLVHLVPHILFSTLPYTTLINIQTWKD